MSSITDTYPWSLIHSEKVARKKEGKKQDLQRQEKKRPPDWRYKLLVQDPGLLPEAAGEVPVWGHGTSGSAPTKKIKKAGAFSTGGNFEAMTFHEKSGWLVVFFHSLGWVCPLFQAY